MAIDWDALYELAPADTTYVKDTDDAIRSLKTATRERVTKEHEFDLASQARQGLHRAGSAVAFYQAAAPTQRVGFALAAADAGLLWVDSDDKLTKVWDGDSFESLHAVAQGGAADTADTVDSQHVTTVGNGIRAIHGYLHTPSHDCTEGDVFDALSPAIPNINDWIPISGVYDLDWFGSRRIVICSRAQRVSSTVVEIWGAHSVSGTCTYVGFNCSSGSSAVFGDSGTAEICW